MYRLRIRSNVDWGSMTLSKLRKQNSANPLFANKDYLERLIKGIQAWDKTMPVSFFTYRAGLQEIHKESTAQLKDYVYYGTDVKSLNSLDYMVACDDDDWVSPNLFNVLEHYDALKEADVIVWKLALISPSVHAKSINSRVNKSIIYDPENDLDTNNFALTKRGIAKLLSFSPGKDLMEGTNQEGISWPYKEHWLLNNVIFKRPPQRYAQKHRATICRYANRESFKVLRIPGAYSTYVRHPCSASLIVQGLNRRYLRDCQRFYAKPNAKTLFMQAPHPGWTEPLKEKFFDLNAKVYK